MPQREIRNRADQFSKKWQDKIKKEGSKFLEIANAQTFYNEFFEVFGKDRFSVARFEEGDGGPKIDLLWPGVLLVEQKRPGENLNAAKEQAMRYVEYLPKNKRPRYIMVSDFNNFWLRDIKTEGEPIKEFLLSDLPEKVRYFDFMLNYNITPRLQSKRICDKDGQPMSGPIIRAIRKNARWLLLVSWTFGLACGLAWSSIIDNKKPVTNSSPMPVSIPST